MITESNMLNHLIILLAQRAAPITTQGALMMVLLVFAALAALVCLGLLWNFGSLWVQAMMSGADV